MGTKGIFGFRKEGQDKLTYNNSDSHPIGLGGIMAEFCSLYTVEELKAVFDDIVLVDLDSTPTIEQITECVRAGYFNMDVSTRSVTDWYCLLRGCQSHPEAYARNVAEWGKAYMTDDHDFMPFAPYAYIINLDTEKLEFWVGYEPKPQDEGRYPLCRLALELPLGPELDPDAAVELMNQAKEKAMVEADAETMTEAEAETANARRCKLLMSPAYQRYMRHDMQFDKATRTYIMW